MKSWLDNAGLVCFVSVVAFCGIAWLVLRPFGWRRFLGRCPLLIVTAGAFFFIAAAELPAAFPGLFQKYLGHSIHGMVNPDAYTRISWIFLWGGRCVAVFACMILGSAVWAIANLIRKDSPLSNALTLILIVGWFYLYVWVISSYVCL
jgi:hypothetical protein